jgi:2-methylaconitate cis-trans-isomerase PrpF
VDVDYTFAQVSVDKPVVSYAGNCGNISSGAGPFAIESGLVRAGDPLTRVRILNTNTNKILVEDIETPGGRVNYRGDFGIPGVPGTAAPVKVLAENPAGSVCGSLLPTGKAMDFLEIPGFGILRVSVVDAANPLVFALAGDLGLTGKERPAELEAGADRIHRQGGRHCNLPGWQRHRSDSPGQIKRNWSAWPGFFAVYRKKIRPQKKR